MTEQDDKATEALGLGKKSPVSPPATDPNPTGGFATSAPPNKPKQQETASASPARGFQSSLSGQPGSQLPEPTLDPDDTDGLEEDEDEGEVEADPTATKCKVTATIAFKHEFEVSANDFDIDPHCTQAELMAAVQERHKSGDMDFIFEEMDPTDIVLERSGFNMPASHHGAEG